MKAAAHILVRGTVQGVGFRWFVEREARKLGLLGYVRNLYSGEVECEVEGERGLIEELVRQLKIGNRASHVTAVEVEWHTATDKYQDFQIRF